MKLTMEMTGSKLMRKYFAALVLGIVRGIREGSISYDMSLKVLFYPKARQEFKEVFPDIEEIIGLGSFLEDVRDIIPEKLEESMCDIEERCRLILAEPAHREEFNIDYFFPHVKNGLNRISI